jgi:carboxypeptidase C (cathepsin A)
LTIPPVVKQVKFVALEVQVSQLEMSRSYKCMRLGEFLSFIEYQQCLTRWFLSHMVPYDQPSAALDMITRWIADVPLS